jgi:hypothetical protein
MLRRLMLTAALTTALAAAAPTVAHGARCSIPESMRSSSPVVDMIRATNVRCSVGRDVAREIIRRYDAGRPIAGDLGAPQPVFTVRARRQGRFTCRGRYVELNAEGDLAYELRCTQRRRVVRVRLYS